MYYGRFIMIKIQQVAEFKSCLTCVHRKPYPATIRNGQPIFYLFVCGLAMDSSRDLVRPEDSCDFWKSATPHFEQNRPDQVRVKEVKNVEDR